MPIQSTSEALRRQEIDMRRHLTLAVAALGLVIVVAVFAAHQQSFLEQPAAGNRIGLPLVDVGPYNQGEPRGIRVSVNLNTAELRVNEERPLELDIALSRQLSDVFEVADAALWTDKEGGRAPVDLQPFVNQSPPEGVQARLLFSPIKRDKYILSVYLAPRDGKAEPEKGLQFLKTATDLNRNFQVTPLNQ